MSIYIYIYINVHIRVCVCVCDYLGRGVEGVANNPDALI